MLTLEEDLVLELKEDSKNSSISSEEIREIIVKELDATCHIEGVLGYMGVYIDSYNDYRNLIGLPFIKIKYYIISNSAVILKKTEDFNDILEYIELNNQKIKGILGMAGSAKVTFDGELSSGLKGGKSLLELSTYLNTSPISLLRKIQYSRSLVKSMGYIIEEEKDMEIDLFDKESFFYGSKLKEETINEFIYIIMNKQEEKKVEKKDIPYSLLKFATSLLLKGSSYSKVINDLKYDKNFIIKEGLLKSEIKVYFGEEVLDNIKEILLKKKRGSGY